MKKPEDSGIDGFQSFRFLLPFPDESIEILDSRSNQGSRTKTAVITESV